MIESKSNLELSVVIPCLNEAETLATCLKKITTVLHEQSISGEIIVADNGSVDASRSVALQHGCRLVVALEKGYGSALMTGIGASTGRYIFMADADDSYDFLESPKFLSKLRDGYDLVQGCRLPSGGGRVLEGAMPFSHRWIGNPLFSWLARRWFKTPIHDVYCGMRGFTRRAYDQWHLRCTGMEFATEMIIKSSLMRDKIAEVPITLHPDGRVTRKPHLKTLHDGWRTLRLFLIACPRWLFLVPGSLMIILGMVGYLLGLGNVALGQIRFDVHTLLFASLLIIMGYQTVLFAAFTMIFAINEHFLPPDPRVEWLCRIINMERGLVAGFGGFALGLILLAISAWSWVQGDYGPMDYQATMRIIIPGVTLTALGFTTIFSGAFMSILGMRRRIE